MDANTVYTIAKALSEKEYIQLFKLMKKDFVKSNKFKKSAVKVPVLTQKEAVMYLLNNVFNKK